MKFFVFLCLLCINQYVYAETKEFDGRLIKEVRVDSPKGEIEVNGNIDSKIKFNIDKIQFDPKCKLSFIEEGSIVKLEITQDNLIFDKATCSTKIKIDLPKNSKLKISTGTAITKVNNLNSEISFKSTTGNFSGMNLESSFYGTTATGNILLKYSKCPERADIEILAATSEDEINLPVPCKIKVTHKSAAGELFNEIGESSDYRVSINVKTASGSLKVLKSK